MLRVLVIALLGISSLMAAKTPRPLPDMAMHSPTNTPIKFKTYKGKALLVVILSTECETCGQSIALLNKIQKDMGPRGVQVVAAAVNVDAPSGLPVFITRYRPTFPIGFMDEADTRKLADLSPTERPYVPIFIFVDKHGSVAVQQNGDSPFFQQMDRASRGMLENLLARP